ncbi:probable calcium-binding protein CML44 [Amborella trichopoda]|nr:probable calcium-binding protein CML44 [Amborella trichopoda]|eukprot:XP_006840949.2 probable calcium-binding protein CML44 [Amborella trichopoda]
MVGEVSVEEICRVLSRAGIGIRGDELKAIVGSETLNLEVFVKFCRSIVSTEKLRQESVIDNDEDCDLKEAFNVFDIDRDGFISSEEVEKVLWRLGLWEGKEAEDWKMMIQKFDENLDGRLDFQEFKNMMLRRNVLVS